MNVLISLTNDKALLDELGRYKVEVEERILKPIVAQAGKMVAAAAAGLVGVQTGLLKQSLGIGKVQVYKHAVGSDVVYVAAGPRRGFRRAVVRKRRGGLKHLGKQASLLAEAAGGATMRNPVKYAHLVERGHAPNTPAHPFLEPAGAAAEPAIQAMAEAALAQSLAAESAKLST